MKLIAVLAVFAAVAATLLGCGGSSDSSSLSRAEFVKEGNKICRQAERERLLALQARAKQLGVGNEIAPPAVQQKIIVAGFPPYEAAAKKLREMAPDAEADKVDEIATAMEEAAAEARSDPGTAVTSGIQFKQADELARKYGLIYCVI